MTRHVLVTNDFPPKLGGIQTYLWELWRRLDPDDVTVLTIDHPGAAEFDAEQPFRVVRRPDKVLLPTRELAACADDLADEVGASVILLDPALPVGAANRYLRHRHGVIVHGAEITVPGRIPGSRALLGAVLRRSTLVIAAGGYPAAEAEHAAGSDLPIVVVPPGVDVERFVPISAPERAAVRARFAIPADARVVLGLSRLVPRKGFDVVIEAAARLAPGRPDLVVAIGGTGRDRDRLERIAGASGAPVTFLGRVPDDDLPGAYGAADVFAMCCRDRWAGLEQEGFGIVFCEAAACGVPSVAGASGGSHEAVVHGRTGLVVSDPHDVDAVAAALAALLDDPARRAELGREARRRTETELAWPVLAARLGEAIEHLGAPGR